MRIDDYLIYRGITNDKSSAFALILGGNVYINGEKITSTLRDISRHDNVSVEKSRRFVSRGGEKLEEALNHFSLNVSGMTCFDAGAATGGFTDCLLKEGAQLVYAVDVAYGKLDWTLRNNPKVVNLEKHNIRNISNKIPRHSIDVCVLDISFTSLKGILPEVIVFMKPEGYVLGMVKPQFELSPKKLRKGIVLEEKDQLEAVNSVKKCGETIGLESQGVHKSSIKGTKGNQEYFILFNFSAEKLTRHKVKL